MSEQNFDPDDPYKDIPFAKIIGSAKDVAKYGTTLYIKVCVKILKFIFIKINEPLVSYFNGFGDIEEAYEKTKENLRDIKNIILKVLQDEETHKILYIIRMSLMEALKPFIEELSKLTEKQMVVLINRLGKSGSLAISNVLVTLRSGLETAFPPLIAITAGAGIAGSGMKALVGLTEILSNTIKMVSNTQELVMDKQSTLLLSLQNSLNLVVTFLQAAEAGGLPVAEGVMEIFQNYFKKVTTMLEKSREQDKANTPLPSSIQKISNARKKVESNPPKIPTKESMMAEVKARAAAAAGPRLAEAKAKADAIKARAEAVKAQAGAQVDSVKAQAEAVQASPVGSRLVEAAKARV